MILLIGGATHSGKTALAQRLLETYKWPYLSIDHLKMGLIRSGNTELTPYDDEKLAQYLWPIVREIIKTAIENRQNLILEGCYIPFDWRKDFSEEYLPHIRYLCLVMSGKYIENRFDDIRKFAGVVEQRLFDSDLTKEMLIADHLHHLTQCIAHNCAYILIDEDYSAVDRYFQENPEFF